MTTAAWITFVLVCAFVWGGALLLVTVAMRKERAKEGERSLGVRER